MEPQQNLSHTHLFSAQQSRQIDRFAIQSLNMPGILLMKRAAWHAFQTTQAFYPDIRKLDILCGTGNNGGDGFALAQFAQLQGKEARIWLLGDAQKIQHDALTTFKEAQALGIPIQSISKYPSAQTHHEKRLIIDALFGTGLDRPLSAELQTLIQAINEKDLPVIALDTPSGLDSDSGRILGAAIQAQHTCSFITYKIGQFTLHGRDLCGQIHFFDLGLPDDAYRQNLADSIGMHGMRYWRDKIPKPDSTHHKGRAGVDLLIGGNSQMEGALQIAASGSLHCGAGLVHIYSPHSGYLRDIPEIQCHAPENSDLKTLIAKADAIAIGPGLGQNDWARQSLRELIENAHNKTLILDADALNLLAQKDDSEIAAIRKTLQQGHNEWILTPHPGEAARLLNCSVEDIQNDRAHAIRQLQQKYGGIVVLKGNGSLIFDGKQMELCPDGNPGMAVGGMGDLLSGIICALAAQNKNPFTAACLGVYLHANAGDKAAETFGLAGVTPSRMLDSIGKLLE
ncbi:NAD(P)H-hydrate dehydratase [Thiomicrorhabdus xiamenensis]|uniref:Bifunctional NAD(P)H-hydrate repair enzyme n=1 Tax=Thiomicrorhabdus xiamenensis TaxID=2739063 RepID=A0A7D4SMG0_9GAMM|nr:NAD(P)H-hydrate dehydratase [Thiomicrorhabdus xiamenensis]QKI88521.1 NAD(P)H-hydrate dehydratase [Thiomicrorhabdus xiamenensis]